MLTSRQRGKGGRETGKGEERGERGKTVVSVTRVNSNFHTKFSNNDEALFAPATVIEAVKREREGEKAKRKGAQTKLTNN